MTYGEYLTNGYDKYLKLRNDLDRDYLNNKVTMKEYYVRIDEILKETSKVFY